MGSLLTLERRKKSAAVYICRWVHEMPQFFAKAGETELVNGTIGYQLSNGTSIQDQKALAAHAFT